MKLLDIPPTKQQEAHTCGPASLRSVLDYFGHPVSEKEMARALDTSKVAGTPPEAMREQARAWGARASIKEGLSLEDLKDACSRSVVPIVAYQAYPSEKQKATPWTKMWESGHYSVVRGVDDTYVHLMDPASESGHSRIKHQDFLDRWHDQDLDETKPKAERKPRRFSRLAILLSASALRENSIGHNVARDRIRVRSLEEQSTMRPNPGGAEQFTGLTPQQMAKASQRGMTRRRVVDQNTGRVRWQTMRVSPQEKRMFRTYTTGMTRNAGSSRGYLRQDLETKGSSSAIDLVAQGHDPNAVVNALLEAAKAAEPVEEGSNVRNAVIGGGVGLLAAGALVAKHLSPKGREKRELEKHAKAMAAEKRALELSQTAFHRKAYDLGGAAIDTSRKYGGGVESGVAQAASALQKGGAALATKVGLKSPPPPKKKGFFRKEDVEATGNPLDELNPLAAGLRTADRTFAASGKRMAGYAGLGAAAGTGLGIVGEVGRRVRGHKKHGFIRSATRGAMTGAKVGAIGSMLGDIDDIKKLYKGYRGYDPERKLLRSKNEEFEMQGTSSIRTALRQRIRTESPESVVDALMELGPMGHDALTGAKIGAIGGAALGAVGELGRRVFGGQKRGFIRSTARGAGWGAGIGAAAGATTHHLGQKYGAPSSSTSLVRRPEPEHSGYGSTFGRPIQAPRRRPGTGSTIDVPGHQVNDANPSANMVEDRSLADRIGAAATAGHRLRQKPKK